jgi:hypothetical protein
MQRADSIFLAEVSSALIGSQHSMQFAIHPMERSDLDLTRKNRRNFLNLS